MIKAQQRASVAGMLDQPGTGMQPDEKAPQLAEPDRWRNKPGLQLDRRVTAGKRNQAKKPESRSRTFAGAGNLPKKRPQAFGQAQTETLRANELHQNRTCRQNRPAGELPTLKKRRADGWQGGDAQKPLCE